MPGHKFSHRNSSQWCYRDGCRCAECVIAHRLYQRDSRERSKSRATSELAFATVGTTATASAVCRPTLSLVDDVHATSRGPLSYPAGTTDVVPSYAVTDWSPGLWESFLETYRQMAETGQGIYWWESSDENGVLLDEMADIAESWNAAHPDDMVKCEPVRERDRFENIIGLRFTEPKARKAAPKVTVAKPQYTLHNRMMGQCAVRIGSETSCDHGADGSYRLENWIICRTHYDRLKPHYNALLEYRGQSYGN